MSCIDLKDYTDAEILLMADKIIRTLLTRKQYKRLQFIRDCKRTIRDED